MGRIMTGTFHMHPENLFSSIHMRKDPFLNRTMMRIWRNCIFNHCRIVQCPTENVRRRLVRWHYKSELRVITNGMIPHEDTEDGICSSDAEDGSFTIITTGRYSIEKDQITLLKAMKYSRYADRIRLILAGRGPTEKSLKRKARKLVSSGVLKYEPEFGFHSMEELNRIYRRCDIYIHCATVEVEGLSCMEAIELGMVPIIATGEITATAQYALSEKSRFPARDARALAERIDWWLEHDAERRAEAVKYKGMDRKYDIRKSIVELQKLFHDALGQ